MLRERGKVLTNINKDHIETGTKETRKEILKTGSLKKDWGLFSKKLKEQDEQHKAKPKSRFTMMARESIVGKETGKIANCDQQIDKERDRHE